MQTLLDDGDQNIDRDGDPELRLDRVLRGAEEGFDPKMLFDPYMDAPGLPSPSWFWSTG